MNFTNVSGTLDGYVTGLTPADFKIAVYIKVEGNWWTKPTADSPLTTIQPDGSWSSDIVTGGIDEQATYVVAYLLPNGVEPPLRLGGPDLPPELASYSQRMVDRTQPPTPEPLCMFTDMMGWPPTVGVLGGGMSWGDYDNDGDLDLLQTRMLAGPQPPHVFRNDSGIFSDVNASLAGSGSGSLAWGDYDGDGDLDLLMAGFAGGGPNGEILSLAKIYRNDGNAVFVDIGAPLEGVINAAVAWGDYDGDGDLDALVTGLGRIGYSTKIYRNDGDGVFTDINAWFPGIRYGTAVAWGDYDNDGDLDLLIAGESVQQELFARIYRNDGSGVFTDIGASLPDLWNYPSVAWGDYNNDGNLDILLTGLTGWTAPERISRIYRNNGDGSFADIHASLEGVYYGAAMWGDYDNDGDLDILITGKGANGGVTRLYRNDGADTFSDIHAPFPPLNESAAAWGDSDNDGDLDIILSSTPDYTYYARYWLFRNDASSPNTAPVTPSGLTATTADGAVTLSWNATSDAQTPATGLSYNVCLGTAPGGCQIIAAHADRSTGFRRLAGVGNAGMRTFATVQGLTPGTAYYWSVQAIDTAFAGSPFAAERSFVVPSADATQVTIEVEDLHNAAIQWQGDPRYISHELWRSTTPYFTAGPSAATLIANGLPPSPNCTSVGSTIRCLDLAAIGAANSCYYLVKGRLVDADSVIFTRVGQFGFALKAGQ